MRLDAIRQLDIGGYPYQVELVDGDIHDDDDENQNLAGEVNYSELRIRLDSRLPEPLRKSVLLHEALHALLYQAGRTEDNEQIVMALGYGITMLLRHNRAFATYLLED